MAQRERQNELKIYLSDDEQYILEQKFKISGMKSKSAFIRHMILYGYQSFLPLSNVERNTGNGFLTTTVLHGKPSSKQTLMKLYGQPILMRIFLNSFGQKVMK